MKKKVRILSKKRSQNCEEKSGNYVKKKKKNYKQKSHEEKNRILRKKEMRKKVRIMRLKFESKNKNKKI